MGVQFFRNFFSHRGRVTDFFGSLLAATGWPSQIETICDAAIARKVANNLCPK
jgi:hypothetical protein